MTLLLVLLVLAVTAVLRHRSSARMVLQEQALQIAEAANNAKSAFLGSVSHDIRTPMNAIIAMTANAFVDDVRNAIDPGMDAHIAKPVQVGTLKSTIRQVLDSHLEKSEGPEETA